MARSPRGRTESDSASSVVDGASPSTCARPGSSASASVHVRAGDRGHVVAVGEARDVVAVDAVEADRCRRVSSRRGPGDVHGRPSTTRRGDRRRARRAECWRGGSRELDAAAVLCSSPRSRAAPPRRRSSRWSPAGRRASMQDVGSSADRGTSSRSRRSRVSRAERADALDAVADDVALRVARSSRARRGRAPELVAAGAKPPARGGTKRLSRIVTRACPCRLAVLVEGLGADQVGAVETARRSASVEGQRACRGAAPCAPARRCRRASCTSRAAGVVARKMIVVADGKVIAGRS